jgi:opacity protein-like surface antigen
LKKLLLSTLLLSSLYAESKIFLGTSYGYYSESLTRTDSSETSGSSNMLSIKAGYGDVKAYAIEFSLDYIDNKDALFSQNDGEKYGLNVDLLKAFDFDIYILPYIKAGFGAGILDTELNDGSFKYGSFNLGLGTFIPINDSLDLELGYNYRYLTYEKDNDTTTNEATPTSHINLIYLGINTRF